MMKLILTLIFASIVCFQGFSQSESIDLPKDPLQDAASETLKEFHQDQLEYSHTVPEKYWDQRIKDLSPEMVYTHKSNLVIVTKIKKNTESGIYVCLPVSSFIPTRNTDGFTFETINYPILKFKKENG